MTNTAKTPHPATAGHSERNISFDLIRILAIFLVMYNHRETYIFYHHVPHMGLRYILSMCGAAFCKCGPPLFFYGIRCPDPSQKRIFPTDFSAPYFTDFNRNGDPKHPDRDTDPGFGFLSQNIFFRTELVSVCLYRLPVDAPVSADSGKPYDKKRYATVFYPDSYRILRQRHPDSFSRCGRSIYRIPSHFQFTLRKQLLEPGISGTCLLSGQFFQTRRKPGPKKADASDTSDRYHRQPGHRHASDEL